MNRVRTWLLALVAVLVLVVVLQNTGSVETRILFATVTMPRAVLLFVTLLAGFVLGLVASGWRGQERGKKTDA